MTDCQAALQRGCERRVGAGMCPYLNPAVIFLLGIFDERCKGIFV